MTSHEVECADAATTPYVAVGIDPGLDGAIAIMACGSCINVHTMPTISGPKGGREVDGHKLWLILRGWPIDLCAIERVHAMPKQGVTSTFTFGVGYGKVLAVLEILGVPRVRVLPQIWQKRVLHGHGDTKNAAISYCLGRFPSVSLLKTSKCTKPHDGIADALCLAEYALIQLSHAE